MHNADDLTINVPLLRKTLEHITAHPDEWDQDIWAERTPCGTVACLAGTAVLLQGFELDFYESECDCGCREGTTASYVISDPPQTIQEVARTTLGLTEDQADDLFESDNTLRDLWAYANSFTNGEIEIPENV